VSFGIAWLSITTADFIGFATHDRGHWLVPTTPLLGFCPAPYLALMAGREARRRLRPSQRIIIGSGLPTLLLLVGFFQWRWAETRAQPRAIRVGNIFWKAPV